MTIRILVLLAGLLLFLPGALLAQTDDPYEGDPDAEVADSDDALDGGIDPDALETIDDLLAGDEEVLSDPDSYTYDPGDRRDPFRSLLRAKTREEIAERPPGLAGLLIDEIRLQGVFVLGDGPVAQIESDREERSFLLREGDQLWDGEVVEITMAEVIFKQSVDDPTALKPFREVVKKFAP